MRFTMWGKTEQVRTSGKNLLDGSKIVIGGLGGSNGIPFTTTNRMRVENIKVEQGKTYSIDLDKSKYDIANSHVFDAEGNRLSGWDIKTPLPDNATSISLSFKKINDSECFESDVKYLADSVMFNEGVSALPYEPYSGGFPSPSPDWEQPIEITDQPVTVTVKGGTEQQSIILTPPKPMTKWDKLEKVDGVWCWRYQTKKYTVTGEESFLKGADSYTQGSSTSFYTKSTDDPVGADSSLMNRLTKNERVWSKPGEIGYTININQIHMRFLNTTLGVSDDATEIEKKTAYANYLKAEYAKGTPYELLYAVKESELIPLSPSEQAQLNALTMYAGTTEVTNTGGCNMELTYTVDTKSYVDSKIAAISAAVLEV